MLTSTEKEILSYVECPICTEFMFAPIYQCSAGHSMCASCKGKMQRCPTCTANIGSTRNYVLESLVTLFNYPCPFAKNGCAVTLSLKELDQHKIVCPNRIYECPFCTSDSIWVGISQQLTHHLLKRHKQFRLEYNKKEDILSWSLNPQATMKGYLYCFNSIFYFHQVFNADKNEIQFAAQYIGNKENASNYTYQVGIQSKYGNYRKIQWTEICSNDIVSFNEIVKSGFYIAIPKAVLDTYDAACSLLISREGKLEETRKTIAITPDL